MGIFSSNVIIGMINQAANWLGGKPLGFLWQLLLLVPPTIPWVVGVILKKNTKSIKKKTSAQIRVDKLLFWAWIFVSGVFIGFWCFAWGYSFKAETTVPSAPQTIVRYVKQSPVTVLNSQTIIATNGTQLTQEEIEKQKNICNGLKMLILDASNQLADFNNESMAVSTIVNNAVAWRGRANDFLAKNLPDYVSEFSDFNQFSQITSDELTKRNLTYDYNRNLQQIKELQKIRRDFKCP
jgi:hypothetical protein